MSGLHGISTTNFIGSLPIDPPRHGYLPPGTRFKPVRGPLGRRRPVGSQSQGAGTRIPAQFCEFLFQVLQLGLGIQVNDSVFDLY